MTHKQIKTWLCLATSFYLTVVSHAGSIPAHSLSAEHLLEAVLDYASFEDISNVHAIETRFKRKIIFHAHTRTPLNSGGESLYEAGTSGSQDHPYRIEHYSRVTAPGRQSVTFDVAIKNTETFCLPKNIVFEQLGVLGQIVRLPPPTVLPPPASTPENRTSEQYKSETTFEKFDAFVIHARQSKKGILLKVRAKDDCTTSIQIEWPPLPER